MRVLMLPGPDMAGESGIKRVVEAYYRYLPEYGITLVKEGEPYDLKAVHAGMTEGDNDVCHCHGLHWTGDYQAAEWEYRTNARVVEAIRHARQVTVPSAWVAETFRRDMRFTPRVIPHGIDWQNWQHHEANEGYVLWNKNRTADVCDNSDLVKLAELFPKVNFATTFAPNVRPVNVKTSNGIVTHAEMKIIIQRAGVYLGTTKETFGIGILEAMAAGVPVLGYAHGGNLDLVEHGVNGYLAQPGDLDDLARGLAYCLRYRDTLGDNGRELAKKWTWARACEMVANVYRLALEEEPATVSVVIPCYNKKPEELSRAIESVIKQSYNRIADIVVVDDGSGNVSEISGTVHRFTERDNRVRYIRQDNKGVAIARNSGISECRGKYICALDADDWLEPTFLEACIPPLEADRSLGITYTGLRWHKPDGDSGISAWPGEFNASKQFSYHARQNQVPTCCVFRREAWARVGGYRQRYAPNGAGSEDAAFWTAVCAAGYGAKKVTSEPLFNYYTGGSVGGNKEYVEVDWLCMYPWAKDGRHPFASVAPPTRHSHPVRQYDRPAISVIIPVGPGHERIVINALDSLEMQHFRNWEAVVVWDGGDNEWVDQYLLRAYPYIRLVSTGPKSGAGYARNRGAEMARAPFLFFLDADDVLNQADALDKMLAGWQEEEAIIYSDYLDKSTWPIEEAQKEFGVKLLGYIEKTGQAIISRKAAEYSYERAIEQPKHDPANPKMPYYLWCTVSILIPKTWHQAVGGFDEKMDTWEDVDYLWRLARAGRCFRRVAEPLLLYNFDTGHRREAAIPRDKAGRQKHQNMVLYIKEKYEGLTPQMCNCRGKRTVQQPAAVTAGKGTAMPYGYKDEDFVKIEYTPLGAGNHALIGAATKIKYGYSRKPGEKFLVHKDDLQLQQNIFKPVTDKITNLPVEIKTTEPPQSLTPAERVIEQAVKREETIKTAKAVQPFDLQSLPGVSRRSALELAKKAKTKDEILALGIDGLAKIKGIGAEKARVIVEYLSR